MNGTYVLYGGGPSRSMLVEMVLAEGAIPYELREVDIKNRANRDPEFLAINPFGWVPALRTPAGEVIGETPAINLWLAETHDLDLVPPPGDADRARFLTVLYNITGEVEPVLKRMFYAHRFALRSEDTEAQRAHAWDMLATRLDPLEDWLAGQGPFFLGNRFTLADLTLAYWLAYVSAKGGLTDRPALVRLLETVRARPATSEVFARHDDWIARLAVLAAKPTDP